MVLGVPSKLASDAIDKGLGVPEVFLEEVHELRPRDQSGIFVATLVLSLSKADGAMEEGGGKGIQFIFVVPEVLK